MAAALALLAAVLVGAMARPRGLPEAVVAVPAAAVVVATGLLAPDAALTEVRELAPTVGFLAAVLLLGHLAAVEGVFTWLGALLASASRGRPRRLFALVVLAASVTTAVLSLDATVVLLTPAVVVTAAHLRLPDRPHAVACGHLANTASSLLPVSNLTNLLAFGASGLTFLGFTALMALPWLVGIAVEAALLRWWFRADLRAVPATAPPAHAPAPRFALVVLALTLLGFGASSALGVEPVVVAAAGALVLAVRALARGTTGPLRLLDAASPLFCLFVLALGVVVAAVGATGLTGALAAVLPAEPTLPALLGAAGLAALLANALNNLPATLLLLAALGPAPAPGLVLAVLLGVNAGPNLTPVGSLATLLWRRVLGDRAPGTRAFAALGAVTVPAVLAASVLALWVALSLAPGA